MTALAGSDHPAEKRCSYNQMGQVPVVPGDSTLRDGPDDNLDEGQETEEEQARDGRPFLQTPQHISRGDSVRHP